MIPRKRNPYSNPRHPLSTAPIPQKEIWLGVDTVLRINTTTNTQPITHSPYPTNGYTNGQTPSGSIQRTTERTRQSENIDRENMLAESRRAAGRDPNTDADLRGLDLLAEARRAAGRDEVSGKKIDNRESEKEKSGMRIGRLWKKKDGGVRKEEKKKKKGDGDVEQQKKEKKGGEDQPLENPFADPEPEQEAFQGQDATAAASGSSLGKDKVKVKGKEKAVSGDQTTSLSQTRYDYIVQKVQERNTMANAWHEPAGGFYAPPAPVQEMSWRR